MVKGGSRAKVNHTRGGIVGAEEDIDRNEVEKNPEAIRKDVEGDDSGGEEATKEKKAPPRSMLARDEELEAELDKQFGNTGLTRKQREELEKQERERAEEKAIKKGESDEAKADMERLAEIRRKREAKEAERAAELEREKAKEAEAQEKAQKKSDEKSKQRGVAEQVAELAAKGKDGKVTLNFLNQDANCKKVLKPLCKKEGVKAINKAWLQQFPDVLQVKEEGKDLVIYPAK